MALAGLNRRSRSRLTHAFAPSRASLVSEASVIAGGTALAYLVALAYRIGAMLRYGLPTSLATVRLSDAVQAGLVVLVGGFLVFAVVDLVESWREGTLERFWIWLMVGLLFAGAVLLLLFVFVFILQIAVQLGVAWAVAASILVGVVAGLSNRQAEAAAASLPAGTPKMEVFEAVFRRHPEPTLAVVLSVFLCLGALTLGIYGARFTGSSLPRTRATDEVAITLSEDRVVLAQATFTEGGRAILTGGFRVLALPSSEVTFAAQRVRVGASQSQ